MSTQPVLPLFVGDYLADTQHLTMEESGTYLHLLMAMWTRDGSIPNDDRDLARMCRLKGARWHRIKARLMPFLIVEEGGTLTQKRLKKEWNRIHSGVENRSPTGDKPANFVQFGVQNRSPNRTKNDRNEAGKHGQNQSVKSRLARGRARAFQSNPIKDKSEALSKGASSYPLASDLPSGASSARDILAEAEAEMVEQYRRAKHIRERLKAAGFIGLRIIPP